MERDVNKQSNIDNTALIYACGNDNFEIIKFLVNNNADINKYIIVTV